MTQLWLAWYTQNGLLSVMADRPVGETHMSIMNHILWDNWLIIAGKVAGIGLEVAFKWPRSGLYCSEKATHCVTEMGIDLGECMRGTREPYFMV